MNEAGPGPAREQARSHPRTTTWTGCGGGTTNRYVAGVAGGLGRHFNIDPTILRVLLVVLDFFGGAGLVIYASAGCSSPRTAPTTP